MNRRFRGARFSLGAALLFIGESGASLAAERIAFTRIESTALGRTLPLAVVSPERTDRKAKGPVLFLLHGRGRNHRSLVDSPAARAALLSASFHIVLPQGEDGWYIDSPVKPADRYRTYMKEVVAWAERNLPVGGAADRRGICGWSMGGFGAMHFAQAQPGQFGFVASVIGLLDFPRAENLPEGQNYRVPVARFSADPVAWRQFNPLLHIEALRGSAITLVLATRGFERTMNETFAAALHERNIPANVHWLEGGHEFSLVERALPLVLRDAEAYFREP